MKYIIRDINQEGKLDTQSKVIAGIIEVDVDNEKVKLIDGWKSVKEITDLKEVAGLIGEKENGVQVTKEITFKEGEKGFFRAMRDIFLSLGFLVEEVPIEKLEE